MIIGQGMIINGFAWFQWPYMTIIPDSMCIDVFVYGEPFLGTLFLSVLLHLHEIVEGLYFHCSLSVCVCVCVSRILVNKIPAERMHRFERNFC